MTIAYWLCTALVALAALGSGSGDLMHAAPIVKTVTDVLHFPEYFMTILGTWKVLGAITLLAPGLQRLKEWAYAGFLFTWTGAIASHLFVGDVSGVPPTVVLTVLTLASWALRPTSRKLGPADTL